MLVTIESHFARLQTIAINNDCTEIATFLYLVRCRGEPIPDPQVPATADPENGSVTVEPVEPQPKPHANNPPFG